MMLSSFERLRVSICDVLPENSSGMISVYARKVNLREK